MSARQMTRTTLEEPDQFDQLPESESEDTISGKVFCINCGYDLHGTPIGGVCPRCQRSASASLRPDDVLETSPEAIRRLSDAANLVYYPAMLLSALGALAIGFVVIKVSPRILEDITVVFEYAFFCAMISPTVSLVGIFMLTRRRTPAYYAARYGNARGITVFSAIVIAFIVALALALYYVGPPAEALLQVSWFAIPNYVFLRGLGRLMVRVRYKKLARLINVAAVWTIVLSVATLFVQMMRWGAPREPELAAPRVALTWLTLLAGIGLWLVVLRLITLARQRLSALRA